jgi:predicted nucleic acid-binding protein
VIVVDASAMLEALLRTLASAAAERRLFASGETVHAPHLLDVEVAQVLRRYAAAGQVGRERCRMALDDLAAFPLRRYPHDVLLERVWELRDSLTAYDAVYVAYPNPPLRKRADSKLAGNASVAYVRRHRSSRPVVAPMSEWLATTMFPAVPVRAIIAM